MKTIKTLVILLFALAFASLCFVSAELSPEAIDHIYTLTPPAEFLSVTYDDGVVPYDYGADFAESTTNPFKGNLDAFYSDGTFEYTPDFGFSGVDYFKYRYGWGEESFYSNEAYVVIGVNNTAPKAFKDKYVIVDSSQQLVVDGEAVAGILFNDTDENLDGLLAKLVGGVYNGTLDSFNEDGTFSYTAGKPNGVDYFTYHATDRHLNSNNVDCVFVIGNNTAPIAVADEYYTETNVKLVVDSANGILANDTNAEDDKLILSVIDDVTNGTLDLFSDGSFNYTADTNFSGIDSFTYQLDDRDLPSGIVQVTIYVGVNKTVETPAASVASGGSANIGGGSCTTNWVVGEWSACVDGKQTRTVSYPTNYCEPVTQKPVETQTCIVPPVVNNQTVQGNGTTIGNFVNGITGAVIGGGATSWIIAVIFILVIAGLLYWIILKRRKANKNKK